MLSQTNKFMLNVIRTPSAKLTRFSQLERALVTLDPAAEALDKRAVQQKLLEICCSLLGEMNISHADLLSLLKELIFNDKLAESPVGVRRFKLIDLLCDSIQKLEAADLSPNRGPRDNGGPR